jgi:hypothetical protein
MDINELEKSFTSLQEVNDGQFRTIVDLKKQLEAVKTENQALKKQLSEQTGAVNNISPVQNGNNISDEHLICITQLELLKNNAVTRELTFEETKKVQIFTDILDKIKKNNSTADQFSAEKLPVEDLLRLVEGGMGDIAN